MLTLIVNKCGMVIPSINGSSHFQGILFTTGHDILNLVSASDGESKPTVQELWKKY
jgi:hypothetical protein